MEKGKQTAKGYTPAQQKVVDRIIELRKSGKGYPGIAAVLNAEKVETFGKGKQWHGPVVRNIVIKHFGNADKALAAAGTKRPQPKAEKAADAPTTREAKSEVKPDPKVKATKRGEKKAVAA